jgi:hypothetical protein
MGYNEANAATDVMLEEMIELGFIPKKPNNNAATVIGFLFWDSTNIDEDEYAVQRLSAEFARGRPLDVSWLHNAAETFACEPETVVQDAINALQGYVASVKQDSPEKRAWVLQVAEKMIEGKGPLGFYLRKQLQARNEMNTLEDMLLEAGVPESAMNEEIWQYAKEIKSNPTISRNRSFIVEDVDGKTYLYKTIEKTKENKTRAAIEAAANYYLSDHFDFIVAGKHPEPIEVSGLYVTVQEIIPQAVAKPIEYWITNLAMFHKEAGNILERHKVVIPEVQMRTVDELFERYKRGKGKAFGFRFDKEELAEAIEYLESTPYKKAIHGDLKTDHRRGEYLIDLEMCGMGNPGIDLAALLIQYKVPRREWDTHLAMYLNMTGASRDELRELKEGVHHSAVYMAHKEIATSLARGYVGDRDTIMQSLAA